MPLGRCRKGPQRRGRWMSRFNQPLGGNDMPRFAGPGTFMRLPSAQTAEQRDRGNILIGISPNGEIWIDKRPVDIRAVRAVVERLVAENPEGSVIIQGDREAQIGLLVKVMDQVRKAGIENVSIAASQEP